MQTSQQIPQQYATANLFIVPSFGSVEASSNILCIVFSSASPFIYFRRQPLASLFPECFISYSTLSGMSSCNTRESTSAGAFILSRNSLTTAELFFSRACTNVAETDSYNYKSVQQPETPTLYNFYRPACVYVCMGPSLHTILHI